MVDNGIGRLAGYGIFQADAVAIAAHMPLNYRQTNNAAELMAALRALQIFQSGEIAICTDSQYVILGVSGAARRRQLRGWHGSSGAISNVSLWEIMLNSLERPGHTVHWVKVPSHVTLQGNNEADRLAEQGRMSHPPQVSHAKNTTPSVFSTLYTKSTQTTTNINYQFSLL